MTRSLRKPRTGPSALRLGTIFVTVAGVAAVLLFQKADILAMVRPGETIEISFAEAHRLRSLLSAVRLGIDFV